MNLDRDKREPKMNHEVDTNHRILVIDDNRAIHMDFKKILCSPVCNETDIDDVAASLFDRKSQLSESCGFSIDSAYQGTDGVNLVTESRNTGRPYAVAFVDVRMPPGMDGVQTVEQIWDIDPHLQIVFCTAYSDYSGAEILQRFGVNERLLILKKPFDRAEVILLATTLSRKWHLSRARHALI